MTDIRVVRVVTRGPQGPGIAYSDTPAKALGEASAGESVTPAREDHVHPLPSCADIGAASANDLSELTSATQAALDQKVTATHDALAVLIKSLPRTLPDEADQLWINGNVLQIS